MYQRLTHLLATALIALSLIGSGFAVHASASVSSDAGVLADHHGGRHTEASGCPENVSNRSHDGGHADHIGGSSCCNAMCFAVGFPAIGHDATGHRTLTVVRQIVLHDLDASSVSASPLRRPPKA